MGGEASRSELVDDQDEGYQDQPESGERPSWIEGALVGWRELHIGEVAHLRGSNEKNKKDGPRKDAARRATYSGL